MNQARQGGCQCGAVRYEVAGEPIVIGVCHCTECQRQSGSAFGMSLIVQKEAFRLLRGRVKTFSRKADSGRNAICAFCSACGVRIYHEYELLKGMVSVKPGTLDDTSFLRPTVQVWTVRKHQWVELPADIRTEAQQG
jgi:hypothetical protein